MKVSQIVIGVGAALALGLLAWQLYMAQTPPYKRAHNRGLPSDVVNRAPEAQKTVDQQDKKAQGQGNETQKGAP